MLTFDPEWLAITRAFNPHMTLNRAQGSYPDEDLAREAVCQEMEWIKEHVVSGKEGGTVKVDDVQQFVMTAPGPGSEGQDTKVQRKSGLHPNVRPPAPGVTAKILIDDPLGAAPYYPNPQTAAFCELLQIENKVNLIVPGGVSTS